ncbi:SigB/SigF/SigG family RNA polymerase sigma factor [Lapillicoccus jejuensis]|uniref:RNA polymerase sigma-B factor n=1 Tax=Lapillicoccus jejuensis TaxID=402171 RepID=A0A542E1P1_9MICO|nr:SigB/SigF/SigG family RNA polymerase sigma factor [Lapillicoccus jejuensis]TQJ09258.1 RNA polymerase sigma-B factor [Lapillicoccus jejuensis]
MSTSATTLALTHEDLTTRTTRLFAERDASTVARERAALEESLVRLHLALADGIASRYAGRGLERDDLVQVARLGLLKAVHRFRIDRGVAFPAFASPTITGEVKRHFRDHGWAVRPPRRLQELHARVGPTSRDLEQRLHRPPSQEELALALEVEPAELERALEAASGFTALSFDHRPGDDAPSLEQQLPAEDDGIGHVEDRVALRAAISSLTARERYVVSLRFDEDLTQSQIAQRLGVSQMQVSRILTKLLAHLREELEPVATLVPEAAPAAVVPVRRPVPADLPDVAPAPRAA